MKWKQPQPKGNRNLLKQAQQIQQQIAKAQEELDETKVEASSGGGVVKVVVTGRQTVQSIMIDPNAVDPNDVEMLQDLVLAAVNEGLNKAKEMANRHIGSITGGLGIPGLG